MFSKNALTSLELQSIEEIKEFQNQKLQEQIKYLVTHSKFYQELFKKYQIDWQSIQTTEDLKLIPVTTKNDLQEFNNDFYVFRQLKSLIIPQLLER